ncbi:MAG TPA: hypothetical protein VGJ97_05975 [Anaerolineaceae bacterium]
MPPQKFTIAAIFILALLFSSWVPTQAMGNPAPSLDGNRNTAQGTQESQYFPETGHWVTGEFLPFYQKAADSLLVYGYPITDAFQDPLTGLTVQYFQKARFELHIEAREGDRVQLSDLGTLLYEAGQPVSMSMDAAACRYFPKQKHSVCYAFLSFYDLYAGTAQFGDPISDMEKQDNLYVQYFERARLEWHPELPAGQRVAITDLGRVYFDQLVDDRSLLEPKPSNNIPQSAIQLQAHVFTARAVVSPNEKQTIYVIVQDQYLRPVALANVAVTIHFPIGGEERYRLPLTDKDGITKFEFNVGSQPYDTITQIQAEVTQGGLQTKTGAWFRIWW